jgi:uncharacterized membrane protein YcfT
VTQGVGPRSSLPSSAQQRLDWVDVARGIAILPVVFYHSVIALPVAGIVAPEWLARLNSGLAPFRMPVLVFLSGMFLGRALAKPARTYFDDKIRTLLWPWAVWTGLTVTILWAGSTFAGDDAFGASSALHVVADQRTYTWYLWNLFAFFVLARLIPIGAHGWCIPALLVMSALLPSDQEWDRFTFLLAFFFAGNLVMCHPDRWDRVLRRPLLVVAAIAAIATLGLAAAGVNVRYSLSSVIGVAAALILLVPVGRWLASRAIGGLLARGGRNSLTYYLTHWPVVTVGIHLIGRSPITNPVVVTLLLMAGGLGSSAVAVLLRSRWAPFDRLYVLNGRDTHRAA